MDTATAHLNMTINSKRLDNGITETSSQVEFKGRRDVALSGLCTGVRRALQLVGCSDELFVAAYLTQQEHESSTTTIDQGAIEMAVQNLKEDEDDA